jgi:hypothetical protein
MKKDLRQELESFVFRGKRIPQRMHGGILRYVEHGILPGDFLRGIICNDLRKACDHGDDENLEILHVYNAFFYNRVPGTAYGSHKRMMEWSIEGYKEYRKIYGLDLEVVYND